MVCGFVTVATILCLSINALAIGRVVILAPAAADIFYKIGATDTVVGVTNNVMEFPDAAKVGTHLNPAVEKIASLRPSLVVTTPGFDADIIRRMGAEPFVYTPKTLREIINYVRILAKKIGKEAEGEALAVSLEKILDELHPVTGQRPTVLYETRSTPLGLARGNSIIINILETAGFRYAYSETGGTVSAEYLLGNQPDYYIYQEGPMNRNPVVPSKRQGWSSFNACAWKVDEFAFARPNTIVFQTVRELNEILTGDNPCEAGRKHYKGRNKNPK